MKTSKVWIDKDKNRLYIKLEGLFEYEEAKEAVDRVISESNKLKPGFDIINDILNFKPVSQEAGEQVLRAQKHVVQKGANRIIRIVDKKTITNLQFNRRSKEAGYIAEVASSIKEAEKMLDVGEQ